jgi:hypothetical protein
MLRDASVVGSMLSHVRSRNGFHAKMLQYQVPCQHVRLPQVPSLLYTVHICSNVHVRLVVPNLQVQAEMKITGCTE